MRTLTLIAALALASTAHADPTYSIDCATIGFAGGTSTSATYELIGVAQSFARGNIDSGFYEILPCFPHIPAGCGDTDLSGFVDVNDISFVIFRLGSSGTSADADGNGTVNVNDISFVIFRLGNQC